MEEGGYNAVIRLHTSFDDDFAHPVLPSGTIAPNGMTCPKR